MSGEFDDAVFKQRFREPIELLIAQKHSGFALMMIAFPLIERLIRGRCKIGDKQLLPDFYKELRRIFPALRSPAGAEAFWQGFRNGILHQGTFSLKGPKGADFLGYLALQALPPNTPMIVHQSVGNFSCLVDPIAFARSVLDEIEKDLETFQRAEPERHPIAFVTEQGGALSLLIRTKG